MAVCGRAWGEQMATIVFTFKNIKNLKHTGKRYDVSDQNQPGLTMRVGATGSKSWIYRFTWHGKRPELTIGNWPSMTLTEAREVAARMRALVRMGLHPRENPTGLSVDSKGFRSVSPTLKQLWDLYTDKKFSKLAPNSRGSYRGRFKHMPRKLMQKPVDQITRKDLVSYTRQKLQAGHSRNLIRTTLQAASRVCEYAQENEFDVTNPFTRFRFRSPKARRVRVLTNNELRLIWNAELNGNIATLTKCILLSGNRCSETLLARWSDIDFKKCAWTLPGQNTKTGNAHEIPFDPWLKEILEDHRETYGRVWQAKNPGQTFKLAREPFGRVSDFVFPFMRSQHYKRQQADQPYTDLSGQLSRYLKSKHGLMDAAERFTLHDMRRTVATRMKRLKVDGRRLEHNVVRATLNHREAIGITEEHYAPFDPAEWWQEHRQGLDLWSQELRSIVDPDPVGTKGRRLRIVA